MDYAPSQIGGEGLGVHYSLQTSRSFNHARPVLQEVQPYAKSKVLRERVLPSRFFLLSGVTTEIGHIQEGVKAEVIGQKTDHERI
jgi:hypothetical protein